MSSITPRAGNPRVRCQSGAALLIVLVVLALLASTVLLDRLNAAAIPAPSRDPESVKSLAKAKSALIAWAATHPDTPGLLPFPDRNDDGTPSTLFLMLAVAAAAIFVAVLMLPRGHHTIAAAAAKTAPAE